MTQVTLARVKSKGKYSENATSPPSLAKKPCKENPQPTRSALKNISNIAQDGNLTVVHISKDQRNHKKRHVSSFSNTLTSDPQVISEPNHSTFSSLQTLGPSSEDLELLKDDRKPSLSLIDEWIKSIQVSSNDHEDLFHSLRLMQTLYSPNPFYMNVQTDITPRMRRILVDWMAEVIEDYDLNQETLHLAVNFVDRYLSLKDLPKTYLQLLGMACLLIASKLEELHPCRIKELIDVCDGAFTVDQIHLMEQKVICALGFGLAASTSNAFCRLYLSKWNLDSSLFHLTNFLLETCLSQYDLLQYTCEEISIAIIYFAMELSLLSLPVSNLALSSPPKPQLTTLLRDLVTQRYLNKVPGITSKYSQTKYGSIACRFIS